MKKIDKLFVDFPELKIIEDWLRQTLSTKNKHPIKHVYKRYRLRKLKYLDSQLEMIRNPNSIWDYIGASGYVQYYTWGTAFLSHLNTCFGKLKDTQGIKNLIKNLKNPSQFFDTVSELEFNAFLADNFEVTLEPKITYDVNKTPKRLDAKAKIQSRDVYFEILTPQDSSESHSQATWTGNRAKNKLLDKLDNQITPIVEKIEWPIILVINTSYGELDEILMTEGFLGQTQVNYTIVKNRADLLIEPTISRASNSVNDSHPYGEYISAILTYNRLLHIWGMDFRTALIPNKSAKFPLTDQEKGCLSKFNLHKIYNSK